MLTWALRLGAALDVLVTLPSDSVHCVCTSPPYFGLRNYGVDGQLGLERSPEEYADGLVAVFSELRRVLRDDGTIWLNLGDSYAGQSFQRPSASALSAHEPHSPSYPSPSSSSRLAPHSSQQSTSSSSSVESGTGGGVALGSSIGPLSTFKQGARNGNRRSRPRPCPGLASKQLIGVPWRVAFALQADGWYLRSDVIWAKPNPMPESVTDRPTKSHEYVFLLTKRERYAYNADAIREPYAESSFQRVTQRTFDTQTGGEKDYALRGMEHTQGSSTRGALERLRGRMVEAYTGQATKEYELAGVQNPSDTKRRVLESMRDGLGANARTVWTIPTEPSPYEHFAVMPRALARKCILAGCPPEGVVLDPFCGTGTSGVVALEEGRNFVGIELNPKYHAIARERLANVAPLLASEVA